MLFRSTHFVHQALERGASKVYAAARNPREWGDDRVTPLVLDVTSPESVAVAADIARDVTVVINNAGASNGSSVLGDLSAARELFEVNARPVQPQYDRTVSTDR